MPNLCLENFLGKVNMKCLKNVLLFFSLSSLIVEIFVVELNIVHILHIIDISLMLLLC